MGLRRRKKKKEEGKLNITSMMDMFTIILVFLLKSFSSSGQLVAPVEGLTIPNSSVEKSAKAALEMTVSRNSDGSNSISIEGKNVYKITKEDKGDVKKLLIEPLKEILESYAENARKMEELTNKEFKGDILLQGDINVDYEVLIKLMYTCGQAGFPNLNLIVYKEE